MAKVNSKNRNTKNAKAAETRAKDAKKLRQARANRILAMFFAAIIEIGILIYLNTALGYGEILVVALPVLKILSAIFLSAGVVMLIIHFNMLKKPNYATLSFRPVEAAVRLIELSAIAICVGTYPFYSIPKLYLAIAAFVMCYLIYTLFQIDFFIISVLCSVTALDLYLISSVSDKELFILSRTIAGVAIAVSAVLLLMILTKLIGKTKTYSLGGVKIIPDNASPVPLIIALTAVLLTLVIALIIAGALSMYMGYGLIALFVGLAVVYIMRKL